MPSSAAKKLIEVALPLDAINTASAREKSIRHGHPSTLHLWWARRPLAAARAVIFTSLVDDPDDPNANPAFISACKELPGDGPNVSREGDSPRMRLFDFIERLVTWEATTDETIMEQARELIRIATDGNPPPLLDPFAGGGSIPLEAQRLGLEAHASDLNPVAVMINKAMIEIPPRFAGMAPVNPRDRKGMFPHPPAPSPKMREGELQSPHPPAPSPIKREGEKAVERWDVSPELERKMQQVARELRNNPTEAEDRLWQAIRNKRIQGKKFRRQMPIGAFVVDFYCPSERLVVEVDGPIHDEQVETDRVRQELIESLGIRFLRLTNDAITRDLAGAIGKIEQALGRPQDPHPPAPYPHKGGRAAKPTDHVSGDESPLPRTGGGGLGVGADSTWKGAAGLAADVRYYGEWMRERAFERIGHLYPKHNGETVIAWLWARTVISPNPAVNALVPLVRSFVLSKKKGRECWARPVIEGTSVRFEVTEGLPPRDEDGTVGRRYGGGRCIISGEPMSFQYIRSEGQAGRLGSQLLAIVTEGSKGRTYYSATAAHLQIAESASPPWRPNYETSTHPQYMIAAGYGMTQFSDLFTLRQLVALTTFSDLVHEARELATHDALAATPLGSPIAMGESIAADDEQPLCDGGCGARAYGEAVSVYLAFAVDKGTDFWSSLCTWLVPRELIAHLFARQAIPMVWDHAEANVFSNSTGNWMSHISWICKVIERLPSHVHGQASQEDAARMELARGLVSMDPPYYDNIPYADISDFFYVWMRRNLRDIYPSEFDTILVPKERELVADNRRFGGREAATQHFEHGLLRTCARIRQYVVSGYPLTVYYAFKQQDATILLQGESVETASTGWETMLTSLIEAAFQIVGTWPVRTERGARSRAIGANALASSIVLVCRPRPEDAPATSRRRFLDALRAELPAAIAEMKTGSIAPVDLAQASIGPGMAIYSRYRAVLEADGTPLTVRTALGLINEALDETLEGAVAYLDNETRFAVGWFEDVGFKEGEFGRANTLAQSKNTAVESVALAGVVESAGGKVRLIHWREYDPGAYDPAQDQRPTVWEGAHHLIERLNHHGEMGAAALYAKLPADIPDAARDLAYRLYHICERKGWAEDARDYNTLVSSWSEISRLAGSREESGTQQAMGLE